jgi:undecaprenyl pyrophosphate phosphatase UppP
VTVVAVLVAARNGEEPTSGLRMAEAANQFLKMLSADQRDQATFGYNDPERLNWHYIPRARKGIPLKALDPEARAAAQADTASAAVGIPMLVLGLILLGDAALIRYSRRRAASGVSFRKLENLGIKDYLLVGVSQGISVLPGVSRSGITTSAMLLMGIEPDDAFRLSFTAGIFAAAGAFGLTLIASRQNVSASIAGIGVTGLLVAIVASTIVSLFLIDFLIKVAGKQKITYLTAGLGIIAIASGLLYLVFGL